MHDWLADALRDRSHTVTASRRLARLLAVEYGRQQIDTGRRAWRSPAVFAWQDWLGELLDSARDPASLPTRINTHQSRILWERCLRRQVSDPLLNIAALVRQSREAWGRLREFGVPLAECVQAARGRDQWLFAQAAQAYQSILEREHWVDDAGLAELVTRLVGDGRLALPPRVTIAGFDRIVPQAASLLEALRASGTTLAEAPQIMHRREAVVCGYDNTDAELRAAGAWARRQLERQPAQRIAVVAANLEQDAARAARLLREGFVPGWQWSPETHGSAVNVSYGRALNAYPACAVALLLLRWLAAELSSREVSMLLCTPLLGIGGRGGRNRLELRLRRLPERSWSPAMLRRELGHVEDDAEAGDWLSRLAGFEALRAELPRRDAPPAWAARAAQALALFNWPGQAPLDSAAFQLVNRWRDLLNELARLELVSDSLSAGEAFARLAAMAAETVFQPETGAAVIQLLGPLEAAGMQFDRIWISGLSAARWPPPARPLALLSRSLQRRHGMPDAEPGDTLAYAQRVLTRLTSSAAEVVCSYPLNDGDTPQTATGLLARLERDQGDCGADPGWHAVQLVGSADAARVDADAAPALCGDEVVAGGAATIQHQLTEPFAAFVYGRLGVRPLQSFEHGLAASLRGSLIHDALHALYHDLPAQASLAAWTGQHREQRIGAALDTAFRRHERNSDDVLRRLFALERRRVAALLSAVLTQESARSPFAIAQVEYSIDAMIGGVPLRLRIDRIDRLDDGRLVILDYKTGMRRRLLDRDGEPKEIQLVVYACALEQAVAGLGLVNIDSRSVSIDAAGPAFAADAEWDRSLGGWKHRVEAAARAMQRGDVRINANQDIQSSRPLSLLSRISELRRDA
jgi:ATP-dependent helicase/nuclease subunit B